MHHPGVLLRPAGPDDQAFLTALFETDSRAMFRAAGLDGSLLDQLVHQQSEARRVQFARGYPDAEDRILELDGRPIGRLLIERRAGELRLVDIALVPEARGRGIGSAVMLELCLEADRSGLPIRLHVLEHGRAVALYRRLGFTVQDRLEPYLFMERPHGAALDGARRP